MARDQSVIERPETRMDPVTPRRTAAVSLRLGPVVAVAGALVLPPLMLDGTWNAVLSLAIIYALMGLSVVVLTGFVGQLSLMPATFVGIGAYLSGRIATGLDTPFWGAAPLAALLVVPCALVIGMVALRLKGLYLAIMTLVFANVIEQFVFTQEWFIGPQRVVDAPRPTLGGIDFSSDKSYYVLVFALAAIVFLLVRNLARSRTARACYAVRDNEDAAQAWGINVAKYKLLAFALSGLIAGFAGSLYGHWLESVPTGPNGAVDPDALIAAIEAGSGEPTIVIVQAGNVNTGAFDDLVVACEAARRQGAWVHVDGAFGLWAAAAPGTRHLTAGVERADSWAVDAHKWLNVPYDGAMAIVADPDAHLAAMRLAGPYLVADPGQRDNTNYVPESSRRARAVPVYAAIRSLGRAGIAEIVDRNCAQARRMAKQLSAIPGAEVLNDVVLNQVLVRLPGGDDANRAAVAAIQRDGTCWLGGTTWNGEYVVRVSISNWATTDEDVDRSAAAIVAAVTV